MLPTLKLYGTFSSLDGLLSLQRMRSISPFLRVKGWVYKEITGMVRIKEGEDIQSWKSVELGRDVIPSVGKVARRARLVGRGTGRGRGTHLLLSSIFVTVVSDMVVHHTAYSPLFL